MIKHNIQHKINHKITKNSTISKYISSAKKFPILTREQEYTTAIKAKAGDKAAQHALIEANLLLVVKIAYEYINTFNHLDDLISEGNLGLLRAIQKFDPEKGYRFTTYAGFWVRSMMLKYIFNNFRLVKTGTTNEQKKLFYNLRKEQARLEKLGIDATYSTIAENLNVDEKSVGEMDVRLHQDVFLDAPLEYDEHSYTRDSLLDDENHRPDYQVEQHNFSFIIQGQIEKFASNLKNERAREILYKRIISDEPETLIELGHKFHISKERVRQLEAGIITKLRKYLRNEASI